MKILKLLPILLISFVVQAQNCNGIRDSIFGLKGYRLADGRICLDSTGVFVERSDTPNGFPRFTFPEGKGLVNKAKEILEEIEKEIEKLEEKGRVPDNPALTATTISFADALQNSKEEMSYYATPPEMPPPTIDPPQGDSPSAKIRSFYLKNKAKWIEVNEFYKTHRRDRESDLPLGPPPPITDIDCWDCDGQKERTFRDEAATYRCQFREAVHQNLVEYNEFLLSICREWQLLEQDYNNYFDEAFPANDPEKSQAINFYYEAANALSLGKIHWFSSRIFDITLKAFKFYNEPSQTLALVDLFLSNARSCELIGISCQDALPEVALGLINAFDTMSNKIFKERNYFGLCQFYTLLGLEKQIQLTGSRNSDFISRFFDFNHFDFSIEADAKIEADGGYVLVHTKLKSNVITSIKPIEVLKENQQEFNNHDEENDKKLFPCGKTYKAKFPSAKLVFEVEDIKDEMEGKTLNAEVIGKQNTKLLSPLKFNVPVFLKIHSCQQDAVQDTILVSSFNGFEMENWSGMPQPIKMLEGFHKSAFGVYGIQQGAGTIMAFDKANFERKAQKIREAAIAGMQDSKMTASYFKKMNELTESMRNDMVQKLGAVTSYSFPIEFKNKNKIPIERRFDVRELTPVPEVVYGFVTIKLEHR